MEASMSQAMKIRPVKQVITAHRQREGGGFIVRRPMPTHGLDMVDPFLMIDEMGPVDYGPGEAVGAPDHPHRGFETVTYLLEGEMEHADSAGHRGKLGPGDVQWMTAGSGIVHSEMPSERVQKEGGRAHGFQIWVNLPRDKKMTHPRYQEISRDKIPEVKNEDGGVRVKVVAGESLGVSAVIDTHTPIFYLDFELSPGASHVQSVPEDHNALIYVFSGEVRTGPDGQTVSDGQLAHFEKGDAIRLEVPTDAAQNARLLLLSGVPHNDPVVHYGPFVMSSVEEIKQAIFDYQTGRMGKIEAKVDRG
jgi:redox-sensitive bicupin YhaK (pirin superfamily)